MSKAGYSPLSRAVSVGSLPLVKILVAAGGLYHSPDDQTVLHSAITQDQVQRIKLLIAAGLNLSSQDYQGSTALHVAARLGMPTILKILFEAGMKMTCWIKTEDQPRMSLTSVGTLDARKCSEKGRNSARRGPVSHRTLRCRRDEPRDSPQFAAMTSDGALTMNETSDDTTPTFCSATHVVLGANGFRRRRRSVRLRRRRQRRSLPKV